MPDFGGKRIRKIRYKSHKHSATLHAATTFSEFTPCSAHTNNDSTKYSDAGTCEKNRAISSSSASSCTVRSNSTVSITSHSNESHDRNAIETGRNDDSSKLYVKL